MSSQAARLLKELDRDDALDLQDWWRDKILEGLTVGSANKDFTYIASAIKLVADRKRLNNEARDIFLTMINTGARPSEIAALLPEDIHLKANIPYISIRENSVRDIKTASSERDIPLPRNLLPKL